MYAGIMVDGLTRCVVGGDGPVPPCPFAGDAEALADRLPVGARGSGPTHDLIPQPTKSADGAVVGIHGRRILGA